MSEIYSQGVNRVRGVNPMAKWAVVLTRATSEYHLTLYEVILCMVSVPISSRVTFTCNTASMAILSLWINSQIENGSVAKWERYVIHYLDRTVRFLFTSCVYVERSWKRDLESGANVAYKDIKITEYITLTNSSV